ncbi:membrane protein insertase YidC [Bacterioplanes sanyensis]|uniref:Membrane protein insertase YidC n=1 Tax=Bacterioplanes sanyensis TaxID=1249553 RepID=A0A222FH56_9GAMM|nr:membrane protein insertase YidC [Bacterioplanes sanyensis]ASP37962.1 membrane protein insertase YidC [Bacterioplanes sanyensis]
MDIRRPIIFIGLAICTYMLILAWNEDYPSQPELAHEQIAATPSLQQETPAISDASATGDAPVVASAAPDVEAEQSSGELIQVQTDVLTLTIDPLGGEVAEVLLPAYPASIEQKDVPFVLLERNSRRTYVAQSGLLGKDGIDANGQALFSSDATRYEMDAEQNTLQVVLTHTSDKAVVEKVFTFTRGDYLIDVEYRIRNTSAETWQGVFYAQLKRDGSGDPSQSSQMGMQSYLGAALTTSENNYEKVSFDDLEDGAYKRVETGGWAAMLQHYFLSAWVPNQEQSHTYNGRFANGNYLFGFYSEATQVAPGETGTVGAQLYVGPKDQNRLAEIAEHLDLTIDYGWLWFIAQPLFWLLSFFHSLVGNWGVAIILLTICIKALFFKPSAMSYRSMANMRKVAPKIQEMRERYGDNREKLGQEMMKLYRDEKVNPMGGCLPILIQMPVFIALYWVLMESVELRQAPFFLWIEDMSIKDPYFILPLIMGASMFFQMKLNPAPQDPMQARVMQFMPIIFTIFFLWFPAGLVLYWVVNNILSIAQQYYINKQIDKDV